MNFFNVIKNKRKLSKDDIDDILKSSKLENRKYLYDVLSIKNITSFDANYIMTRLNLTSEKIKAINLVIKQYEAREELQEETYSDFLFRVVRNIENLEKENMSLLNEIKNCKNNINNFNKLVEYLILKSCCFFENKKQGYVFSCVYIDKK